MLKTTRLLAITGISAALTCSQAYGEISEPQANKKEAKTQQPLQQDEIRRLSEAFGNFIGKNLSNPGIKFDLESLIKGIREGAAGKPSPMADQEYESLMTRLQENAYQQLSEDNLKAADKFLEQNARQANVKTLEPGKLQYLILQEGRGAVVSKHGTPQIRYTGKYIDGTVFGSSEEVNGPLTIPLDQTIPGFSKGILGMKEGEKRRIFVHPDLGYGTMGQVPPNALLIFDVEVVKADTENSEKNIEEEFFSINFNDEKNEPTKNSKQQRQKTSVNDQSKQLSSSEFSSSGDDEDEDEDYEFGSEEDEDADDEDDYGSDELDDEVDDSVDDDVDDNDDYGEHLIFQ